MFVRISGIQLSSRVPAAGQSVRQLSTSGGCGARKEFYPLCVPAPGIGCHSSALRSKPSCIRPDSQSFLRKSCSQVLPTSFLLLRPSSVSARIVGLSSELCRSRSQLRLLPHRKVISRQESCVPHLSPARITFIRSIRLFHSSSYQQKISAPPAFSDNSGHETALRPLTAVSWLENCRF